MSAIVKDARSKLMYMLADFASQLSNVTDEQLPAAFKVMDDGRDLFNEGRERFRQRLIAYLKKNGQPLGDKGSLTADIAGATAKAIKTKTGLDPKKVEAKLRALGLPVEMHMTPTMTFAIKAGAVEALQAQGLMTENDVASCMYDPTWRIEVSVNHDT